MNFWKEEAEWKHAVVACTKKLQLKDPDYDPAEPEETIKPAVTKQRYGGRASAIALTFRFQSYTVKMARYPSGPLESLQIGAIGTKKSRIFFMEVSTEMRQAVEVSICNLIFRKSF